MAERSPRPALHAAGVTVAAFGLLASVLAGCAGSATPAPSVSGSPASTASPGTASPTSLQQGSPTPSLSPTPVPSPTPVGYVVAAGDTLFSIARRFDTTARSIAYWNRVTYPSLDPESPDYAPDRIVVGWTLTLWPGQEVDEASPPPGPSPTPRPSVSIGPGVTPRPDGTSVVVDHGARDGNAVAITFDLGGRTDPAVAIVTWLIDHDVQATVFPTGETGTTTTAGREVLTLVAAHPDLFTIGNHTWVTPDLTQLDASAVTSELDRTEVAIEQLIGRSTKPFFRPPYGAQDLDVRTAAGAGGWSYTVMWDVDSLDWKLESDGGPTTDDLTARVLARVQGGSIVLMHLGGYHTLEALPDIVGGLADRGLEPVTLARLLGTG